MVNTTDTIITANPLPAILMGGPPNAGKSVLTYNLTRELRRLEIPHYVFRANPDIEGDWFLQGDLETVRQIQLKVSDYRHWTDIFREFVCRDLAHRYLPLIVDLGGLPRDADAVLAGPILLEIRADGNHHVIVQTLPQRLALLLSDADDLVSPTIQPDFAV